ncbi:GNAT family N-acetyltransferase [Vibrio splendidus]
MKIEFLKLKKDELSEAFEIFKAYMKPVIDGAFGWDEGFQKNGFESRLKLDWFSWILVDGEKVGLVCNRLKQNSIHIHLLVIFTEAQRRGLASSVTQKLNNEANERQLNLTLSCFKNNEVALQLYKRLGFVIISEDEHFYDLVNR